MPIAPPAYYEIKNRQPRQGHQVGRCTVERPRPGDARNGALVPENPENYQAAADRIVTIGYGRTLAIRTG